mmetsp:Transcript_8124/g.17401  ORF Transcript_8124/g.17401 Transcript_8124/m.17401 type:complete len:218 (-) Transcript_8124:87-740(-)
MPPAPAPLSWPAGRASWQAGPVCPGRGWRQSGAAGLVHALHGCMTVQPGQTPLLMKCVRSCGEEQLSWGAGAHAALARPPLPGTPRPPQKRCHRQPHQPLLVPGAPPCGVVPPHQPRHHAEPHAAACCPHLPPAHPPADAHSPPRPRGCLHQHDLPPGCQGPHPPVHLCCFHVSGCPAGLTLHGVGYRSHARCLCQSHGLVPRGQSQPLAKEASLCY